MKLRSMIEGDINFVLSTWLKSYYEELKRNGSKGVIYPKDDVFFQGHQSRIKEVLKTSECLVCVAPDEDNQIIGWIVFDKDAIHYCYVKQVFRKMGVARELQKQAIQPRSYSHHTRFSRYLNKGLTYNPYSFLGASDGQRV